MKVFAQIPLGGRNHLEISVGIDDSRLSVGLFKIRSVDEKPVHRHGFTVPMAAIPKIVKELIAGAKTHA